MALAIALFVGFLALAAWLYRRQQAREQEEVSLPWDTASIREWAEPDRPSSEVGGNSVRHLSSEELAGVAANLYSARGFTLVRQEVNGDRAELLLESPSRRPVVVRCIPAPVQPLGAEELENAVASAPLLTRRKDVSANTNALRETVLVMPGHFSEDARGVAERNQLELVDAEGLLQLMRRYLPGAAEALRLVSWRQTM